MTTTHNAFGQSQVQTCSLEAHHTGTPPPHPRPSEKRTVGLQLEGLLVHGKYPKKGSPISPSVKAHF